MLFSLQIITEIKNIIPKINKWELNYNGKKQCIFTKKYTHYFYNLSKYQVDNIIKTLNENNKYKFGFKIELI